MPTLTLVALKLYQGHGSPLFVAAWYSLAIGFAALGAVAGSWLLRWRARSPTSSDLAFTGVRGRDLT